MARYRGFVSAEKILSELGAEATTAAKEALAHGADDVVAEAKNRCPVYTGTDKRVVKGALRDSIHKRLRRKDGSVWRIAADAESQDGVFYGVLVEFSPRINKPFLYPALDAEREAIKKNIVEAVKAALRREGR